MKSISDRWPKRNAGNLGGRRRRTKGRSKTPLIKVSQRKHPAVADAAASAASTSEDSTPAKRRPLYRRPELTLPALFTPHSAGRRSADAKRKAVTTSPYFAPLRHGSPPSSPR